jgi:hypothetical protein
MILSCGRMPIMLLVFSDQTQRETKMKEGIGGPFLQMAVFCEKALQEKDGVMSAIRIVDRFTLTASSEVPPGSMPTMNLGINLIIAFKSGDIKGKMELRVRPVSPSGQEMPGFVGPLFFEGGDHGSSIVIQYGLSAKEEGIYWFDIMLNNKFVTKIPLRIIYAKATESKILTPPVH